MSTITAAAEKITICVPNDINFVALFSGGQFNTRIWYPMLFGIFEEMDKWEDIFKMVLDLSVKLQFHPTQR